MPQDSGQRRCLADIVMAKLREHEEQMERRAQNEKLQKERAADPHFASERIGPKKEAPLSVNHPKVIQTYRAYVGILQQYTHNSRKHTHNQQQQLDHSHYISSVGDVMKRYRSGKVPKAFKIIPALANWEEVVRHLPAVGSLYFGSSFVLTDF